MLAIGVWDFISYRRTPKTGHSGALSQKVVFSNHSEIDIKFYMYDIICFNQNYHMQLTLYLNVGIDSASCRNDFAARKMTRRHPEMTPPHPKMIMRHPEMAPPHPKMTPQYDFIPAVTAGDLQ